MRNFIKAIFFTVLFTMTMTHIVHANSGDDTIPTARKAKINTTISGTLNNDDDIDYYAVSIPENGQLTISTSNSGYSKTVSLRDGKNNSYIAYQTNSDYLGSASRSLGVKKGSTVYIRVSTSTYYDGIDYKVKVTFTKGNNFEKEWNDDLRSATTVSPTSTTKGILSTDDDKDYYKFKLTKAGNMNFSIDNAGYSKRIVVLDGNLKEYGTFTTNNQYLGKSSMNIALPKGTYYFYIQTTTYYDNIPYAIKIKFTKSNYYEKEINDTARDANSMTIGKTYTGAFQYDDDDDYFKVKVTKTGSYRLSLNNTAYGKRAYLYTSSLKEIASVQTDTERSGYSYVNMKLKKGTYYIKAYNRTYYDHVSYKIKFTKNK